MTNGGLYLNLATKWIFRLHKILWKCWFPEENSLFPTTLRMRKTMKTKTMRKTMMIRGEWVLLSLGLGVVGPSCCIGCAASDLRWGVRCRIFTRQIYPGEHHRPGCQWGKLLSISGSWKSVDQWMVKVKSGFTGPVDLSPDTCNLSRIPITGRRNMIPLVKTGSTFKSLGWISLTWVTIFKTIFKSPKRMQLQGSV